MKKLFLNTFLTLFYLIVLCMNKCQKKSIQNYFILVPYLDYSIHVALYHKNQCLMLEVFNTLIFCNVSMCICVLYG